MISRGRFEVILGLTMSLALTAVVCVHADDTVDRVYSHNTAIQKLDELGANLVLTSSDGTVISSIDEAKNRGLFGQMQQRPKIYAPMVALTDVALTSDVIRSMIPHLRQVIPLEGQNIAGMSFIGIVIDGNPALTTDLEKHLKAKLPNCRLAHDPEFQAEVDRVLPRAGANRDGVDP